MLAYFSNIKFYPLRTATWILVAFQFFEYLRAYLSLIFGFAIIDHVIIWVVLVEIIVICYFWVGSSFLDNQCILELSLKRGRLYIKLQLAWSELIIKKICIVSQWRIHTYYYITFFENGALLNPEEVTIVKTLIREITN